MSAAERFPRWFRICFVAGVVIATIPAYALSVIGHVGDHQIQRQPLRLVDVTPDETDAGPVMRGALRLTNPAGLPIEFNGGPVELHVGPDQVSENGGASTPEPEIGPGETARIPVTIRLIDEERTRALRAYREGELIAGGYVFVEIQDRVVQIGVSEAPVTPPNGTTDAPAG